MIGGFTWFLCSSAGKVFVKYFKEQFTSNSDVRLHTLKLNKTWSCGSFE